MFHALRSVHRWVGIVCSLFLIVLACTGFLLVVKKRFSWIQPPTHKGSKIVSMHEVASIGQVAEAVFALSIPELRSHEDFHRFELHADKNVIKVQSKEGYHEVQVDAKTATVLSVGKRNDSLIESIHDLSYISGSLHDWGLPAVALGLLALGSSGIYMYSVPVTRRRRFRRQRARNAAGS
jgi:uncharacterized iron-regulated membrane protein